MLAQPEKEKFLTYSVELQVNSPSGQEENQQISDNNVPDIQEQLIISHK